MSTSFMSWLVAWYPFYMVFRQYVHREWYHKSINIGKNCGPCPKIDL